MSYIQGATKQCRIACEWIVEAFTILSPFEISSLVRSHYISCGDCSCSHQLAQFIFVPPPANLVFNNVPAARRRPAARVNKNKAPV